MKKLSLTLILLISLTILPLYGFAQNTSVKTNKSLLASLYCATLGAWLASPRCIEENNTILPAPALNTIVKVNQNFNSTTTQLTNTASNTGSANIFNTSAQSYTTSDVNLIVNSAVQRALSSYSNNSNPDNFVTRDFLARQIGAIGDSAGRSMSSVSSSITTNGSLTNSTLTTPTITGGTINSSTITNPTISGASFLDTTTYSGDVTGLAGSSYERLSKDVNSPLDWEVVPSNGIVQDGHGCKMIVGDYIYAFGGQKPSSGFTAAIRRAPLNNPTNWENASDSGAIVALPSTRAFGTCGIVGDYIYWWGGDSSASIWKAPVSNPKRWVNTGINIPFTPSLDSYSFIVGNNIYMVSGGTSNTNIYSASTSDPLTWIDTGVDLPTGIYGTNNAVFFKIGDYVYLVGNNDKVYRSTMSSPTNFAYYGDTHNDINVGYSASMIVGDYAYIFDGYQNINIYRAPISDMTAWVDTGYDMASNLWEPQVFRIGNYLYMFSGNASDWFGQPIIQRAGIGNSSEESDNWKYAPSLERNDSVKLGGNEAPLEMVFGNNSTATTSSLSIFTNATRRISVAYNGLVGISTTSPYAMLSISNLSTATTTLALRPIASQTANILDIYSTTGKLTSVIGSSGNFGIGTTSPYSMLSVAGQIVGQNFVATSTTATSTIGLGGLAVGTTTPYGNGLFTVGTSSPLLYVDRNNGNIGLGTSNPTSPLQILSSRSNQFRLGYDGSNYSTFNVDSAGSLSLTAAGNTGNLSLTTAGSGNFSLNNGGLYFNSTQKSLSLNNSASTNQFEVDVPSGAQLDTIPTMTSNTAPNGVASCDSYFGIGNECYKAFDKNTGTVYVSGGASLPHWLAYEFTSNKTIVTYTITPRNQNYPKDWTFEGWDGSQWITLDTRANITFVANTKQTYNFSNTTSYIKYRLYFTAADTSFYISAQEVQMMEGSSYTPAFAVTTAGLGGFGTSSPLTQLSIQSMSTTTDMFNVASSTGISAFYINRESKVGIGTTSPYAKLSVVGTVAINGLTANSGSNYAVCINNTTKELTADVGGACNPSSERFKNNIEPLSVSATDIINSLKPSSFAYNDTIGTRYGLIAEQVSSIDPHLATYEEDGITPHGLDTSAIISVLVKAVQELTVKLNTFITEGIASIKDLVVETLTATVGNFKQGNMDDLKINNTFCVDNVCMTKDQLKTMFIQNGGTIVNATTSEVSNNSSTQTQNTSTAIIQESQTTNISTSETTPTPTPTASTTPTVTSTPTPTSTPTETPTETPITTAVPTPTPSDTSAPSETVSPTSETNTVQTSETPANTAAAESEVNTSTETTASPTDTSAQ